MKLILLHKFAFFIGFRCLHSWFPINKIQLTQINPVTDWDVFRTVSIICDGTFLWKEFMGLCCWTFLQRKSTVCVFQGPIYKSAVLHFICHIKKKDTFNSCFTPDKPDKKLLQCRLLNFLFPATPFLQQTFLQHQLKYVQFLLYLKFITAASYVFSFKNWELKLFTFEKKIAYIL